MNLRAILLVALCAAIATCAYFFLAGETTVSTKTLGPSADSSSGASSGKPTPGNPQPADGAAKNPGDANPPKVNWEVFKSLEGNISTPEATPADLDRFLAKHGETAANLVAAFENTGDRRWLDRALELFPNSPIVLMKAIESLAGGTPRKDGEAYQANKERLDLIERFKAADPNNPVPWLFAAQEFFKAKQTAEGVAEIRAALERPAFYTYSNERTDSAQRLYESLGLGSLEASALAMFGLTLTHMSAAQQSSRGLMEWQKSSAESGDTVAAEEALRLTYGLGRTFATPEASRLLIGQLVGFSMEKRALEALPADAQRDWLTVAPAQRLAEIERQKQLVKEVTAASDWVLKSRDEQLFAEWLRRVRTDGEAAALSWVKAQKK